MMRILLLLALVVQAAGAISPPSQNLRRLPLQKKRITLKSPTNYIHRILRYDSKTSEPVYYDPKPRVVLLDSKSGKYGLRWIGYDGKEKEIIYLLPNAINVVVIASVSKSPSGDYVYLYNLQNLPSSGQNLAFFSIQTFASDVRPIPIGKGYVGQMTRHVEEFRNGNWIGFGSSNFIRSVIPGGGVELKLVSPSPPGVVECRVAGGKLGMKGVGEEPPQELENVLPGYEAWPSGYTIGPVDELRNYSATQLAQYIRERLPRFRQLGWISSNLLPLYEQNLTGERIENLYRRLDRDLKSGNITTEVFAIVRSMKK